MSKHTPGPWAAGMFHDGDPTRPRTCIRTHPDSPGRGWVCDMDQGKEGTAEGEANARLIAAAPDLLDTLAQLLTAAVDVANHRREEGLIDIAFTKAIVAADEAIARARGTD